MHLSSLDLTNTLYHAIKTIMKIRGPLLSNNAHGSIGNVLTFSKRKTHQHARNKQGAYKKITNKQVEWRLLMDLVSLKWNSLSQGEKDEYRSLGSKADNNITGFQYLAHVGMVMPTDYLDVSCFAPLQRFVTNTTATDFSQLNSHFNTNNKSSSTVNIVTFDTRKIRWRMNKLDKSFYLRSPGEYDLELTRDNFSISFLSKRKAYIENTDVVYNIDWAEAGKGFAISLHETGLSFYTRWGGASYRLNFYNIPNIDNNFFFFTFVSEDAKLKLYVNGILFDSQDAGAFDPCASKSTFIMPTTGSIENRDHFISNMLILKRKLSASECMFLYKSLKLDESYV